MTQLFKKCSLNCDIFRNSFPIFYLILINRLNYFFTDSFESIIIYIDKDCYKIFFYNFI